MASFVTVVCPYCRCPALSTPEELCAHVEENHRYAAPIQDILFPGPAEFQTWLSRVELARSEGGMLASDPNEPADESDYYLFCHSPSSPQKKRRRLETPSTVESHEVSCTAFVHVRDRLDGSVDVTFCLEHNWDCESADDSKDVKREQLRASKRTTLKRNSEAMSCDDVQSPLSSPQSSPSSDMSSGVTEEWNNNKNQQLESSSLMTSMNNVITQKLDTTADRLKVLTQVLADLAVDIQSCGDHQIPIVI